MKRTNQQTTINKLNNNKINNYNNNNNNRSTFPPELPPEALWCVELHSALDEVGKDGL